MAEENLIIETPEHVELQFALASLGNRFLACAIDHLLQVVTAIIVFVILITVSSTLNQFGKRVFDQASAGSLWAIALMIILLFVIFFGYFAIFESIWSGQTPGKRILKLRVIKEDGRPINTFDAMARNLLRLVDSMPTPYYSIGILSVFVSERSKRLGDFVANTVVIKERTDEAPTFEEVFERDENEDRGFDIARRRIAAPVNFVADIKSITRTEIEVIEAFLRRRYELPQLPRQWMAWRVAMPILEKIRPSFERDNFTYEGFLEELLARYRKIWN